MPEQMRTTGQSLTQMRTRRYSEPSLGRRSVRRPEDIQRDVRGLKLRQRVSLVLNDEYIRHELENTVGRHTEDGDEPNSVRTYQDFLVPTSNYYGGLPGVSALHPINDIRGTDTLNYTKSERNLRCKLASVYRLVDMFGWSDSIYNHCTVRCPAEHGQRDNILINPFGLTYSEITASSLVKIDGKGEIVEAGSTCFAINKAGYVIHSAVHQARKDVKCAIHVEEKSTVAVASTKFGLLPISQNALMLGPISYHDYEGVVVDEEERERIIEDFPEGSKVLILRNHGLLCVGETIEEAFYLTYLTILACQAQVKAMSAGYDNLIFLDSNIQKKVHVSSEARDVETTKTNLSCGVFEFEAWMRMLDSQGHRTGHVYHNPDLFNKTVQQPKSDARSPATMTSYRYDMLYGDNQNSPARRVRSLAKGNTYKNRSKWLNTPVKGTEYRKEFIQDIMHSEPAILKDSQSEKETVVKKFQESKVSDVDENVIVENITSTQPAAIVMSEIPLESLFDEVTVEEPEVFIEKGSNGAETKEVKRGSGGGEATASFSTSSSTRIVTMSRTVVKSDGSPVTTVEKTLLVNGEEQPVETNLLSPPGLETEGSEESGDKEGNGDKGGSGDKGETGRQEEVEGAAEGGKPRQKVKKKKSFKKTFQDIIHRPRKSEKDEDGEKS